MSNDTENSKEGTNKENCDQVADWRLQGEEDTDAKTVTLSMNSGTEAVEASTPHKHTDGQPQRSEPISDALMLPVPSSLQGKKRGSNLNPCPVYSGQSLDLQIKQKLEPSLFFLTAGPRRKCWNLLTSLS